MITTRSITTALPPDHLYIELTDRCNLACAHCYLAAGPNGARSLPTEAVLGLLHEFAAMAGETVAFSGGEPLLHPGLLSCVSLARNLNLGVTVVTNGLRLRDQTLDRLLQDAVTLAISVDGANEETHDAIRGLGSFRRLGHVLDRIERAGAQRQTTICFTPMRRNLGELTPLVTTLAERGFRSFYISLLEARGRAPENDLELALDTNERAALLTELALLQQRSIDLYTETGHLRYFFARLFNGWDGASDPIEMTLRVAPDGALYLTAYVDHPFFHLGNICQSSLAVCWDTSHAFELREAAERRGSELHSCHACPYWIICGGGSPARAFAVHGRLDTPDDWCNAKMLFLDRWFGAS